MDVIKKKQAKPLRKLFILISIPVVLVSIWFMMGKLSDQTSTKLERHSIIIGNVQRGNLDVEVTGYGVLRSNKQKLITAQDPATVNEILVRPGGEVLPDTIILKMQDPDLTQQLASAGNGIKQTKSQLPPTKTRKPTRASHGSCDVSGIKK